jgi:Asp-tRNA(Asn)/Glu-tRNA(Gln) amidotransferase A subunit family amidase
VRIDPASPHPTTRSSACGARSGLSSRDGVVPLSHTQDIAGPLARTVTDVAILLDATPASTPRIPSTKLGEGHRSEELPATR